MSTLGRRGNRNLKYSDTGTGKHIVTVRGATYHGVCAQASYSKDILRGGTTRPQAPTDLVTLSTASFPDGEGKQEAVPREARERKTIPSKVTEATFVFIKIVFDS